MIDYKPLLFANFLAIMLLVTAGFAPIPRVVQTVTPPRSEPRKTRAPEPAPASGTQPEKPTHASLTLRSNVYNDRVRINGEQKGSTAMDLKLEPGPYTIEITKPQHSTWREQIHLEAGDSPTLMARLQRPNGDVYEGEFRGGEYHGRGTLTASNGDTFTGNWENGELNGHGTLTTAEGLMYVGDFRDGKLHGKGRLTYPDGSYYRGDFANNRFHGEGTRTFASGRQYQGEFVDGQFHGQGEIRHPSGARIESTFREGDPYGEIRMTTPEGEVFTAQTNEPGVCYREASYRATQCPSMEAW